MCGRAGGRWPAASAASLQQQEHGLQSSISILLALVGMLLVALGLVSARMLLRGGEQKVRTASRRAQKPQTRRREWEPLPVSQSDAMVAAKPMRF